MGGGVDSTPSKLGVFNTPSKLKLIELLALGTGIGKQGSEYSQVSLQSAPNT